MATKKATTTSKRAERLQDNLSNWGEEDNVSLRATTGLFDYETGTFEGVRPVDVFNQEGPNKGRFCRFPNELFQVFPFLRLAEIRVVLAIVRKTYGENRREARLSLSLFGMLTHTNDDVNIDAIRSLEAKGIITVRKESRSRTYYSVKYRPEFVGGGDFLGDK